MLEMVRRKGTLLHCWWECKLIWPLWRTAWGFLNKLRIKLPCNPAVPLVGIYPEETMIEKDTGTPGFIVALSTGQGSSLDGHQQKLWYIYTMEYYSTVKRNALESVLMKWMNPGPVIQSEVSEKEKNKYFILTYIRASQVALVVKNPPDNAGRHKRRWFSPWIRKTPWRRQWQPTPVFLPGESLGQRSLAGCCSPEGRTELDTTEGI